MVINAGFFGHEAGLTDRLAERAVLDSILTAARAGQSSVLVVHGEPGIGKTELVEYLAGRATACRVVRVAGVQSEMELAFAGLHQLCSPILVHLEGLPGPQQAALRAALGIDAAIAPDLFLVGLAVLGLLAEAAGERPVVCLVDDVHWLDRASIQVLGFVARRLEAESVALVFAARMQVEELANLPELALEGLSSDDARTLLESVLAGPLDRRVKDQIVAETRGNPLALLELPRGLTLGELAGGFGLPSAVPLYAQIEQSFNRQLTSLPAQTRRLVQLAAADPSGDASLVWRAARQLRIPIQAAGPELQAGLANLTGQQMRFRHPLARSAAYWSMSPEERQQTHAALAEATDAEVDPDRRAWHRAAAAPGPDEEVAAELEDSAARARGRGGLAAAMAFFERAVLLTGDPGRRAGRALAAAQASLQVGAFDRALELLTVVDAGPLDDLQRARATLLRGQIAFARGLGRDSSPLLLKAARQLEPLDPALARQTYLEAWQAAMFAGHLVVGADLTEISRSARHLPPANPQRPTDQLLDGLSLLGTEGPAAAESRLREAVTAFATAEITPDEVLQWGWMATAADDALFGHGGSSVTARQIKLARDVGALGQLPLLLNRMAGDEALSGDFEASASLIAEAETVCEATGIRIGPLAAMLLAALRGREDEATTLIRATLEEAAAGGQGFAMTWAHWTAAILYNGLSRYAEALDVARRASDHSHIYASVWVLPELIEAAVRTGEMLAADEAMDRLAEWTQAGAYDFGLGIEARARSLLSEGSSAEGHYREAIDRLGRTRGNPELARAHLLFGEWLRRERRRTEAREHLRTACQMLDQIGMEGFAARAHRELAATGETARPRSAVTRARPSSEPLTAQEAQVASLARDGLSNPEIGARLFISARTVQYHLSKVFTKFGISSRGQLHRFLPTDSDPVPPGVSGP